MKINSALIRKRLRDTRLKVTELLFLELSFELIREAGVRLPGTLGNAMVIPNEEFASSFRLLKYVFLFLGGYLGMFGMVMGIYLTVSHLAGLLSFGMPYLMPFIKKILEARMEKHFFRETAGRRCYTG